MYSSHRRIPNAYLGEGGEVTRGVRYGVSGMGCQVWGVRYGVSGMEPAHSGGILPCNPPLLDTHTFFRTHSHSHVGRLALDALEEDLGRHVGYGPLEDLAHLGVLLVHLDGQAKVRHLHRVIRLGVDESVKTAEGGGGSGKSG